MDKLKETWKQVNKIAVHSTLLQNNDSISIYEQLQKEDELRKKFNPFLVLLILLIPLFFIQLLKSTDVAIDTQKIIGIGAVTCSGVAIGVFSQFVRIPLQPFNYDQTSAVFLQMVKQKLQQRKTYLLLGVNLQVLFLGIGLYLLIFGSQEKSSHYSHPFLLIGIIAALWSLTVGMTNKFYNNHYRELLQKIDSFLED